MAHHCLPRNKNSRTHVFSSHFAIACKISASVLSVSLKPGVSTNTNGDWVLGLMNLTAETSVVYDWRPWPMALPFWRVAVSMNYWIGINKCKIYPYWILTLLFPAPVGPMTLASKHNYALAQIICRKKRTRQHYPLEWCPPLELWCLS